MKQLKIENLNFRYAGRKSKFSLSDVSLEVNAGEFIKRATDAEVRIVPGVAFNCDTTAPSQSFRLNYSTPSDEQIIKGISILGKIAKDMGL